MADVVPALPPDLTLPILPEPLIRFNRRSSDPEVTLSELASILDQDASLTCELLKSVNNSAGGRRSKATTTLHALSLLGVKRVRLLVLSTAIERQASEHNSPLVFARLFVRANLERALFAQQVAGRLRADVDLAFAAGLMQDFLLPVLTRELLVLYSDFIEKLRHGGPDLSFREKTSLGWDHAEAAAHVMAGWGFPDELVCCVRMHHRVDDVTADARLRDSAAAAVAISSLLPDPIRQCPQGIDRLGALCRDDYGFDPIELAGIVDELMLEQLGNASREPTLTQRLLTAMPAAV